MPEREEEASATASGARGELAGERVLVTGASGFIGSHLVRALVRDGAEVHVLLRARASRARLLGVDADLEAWEGDITDRSSVQRVVDGARPDIVYHLAADTGVRRLGEGWPGLERSLRVNLEGTLGVLRACLDAAHPVRAFVRTGGLEEYGDGPIPYREDQRERPISPYSASQVAATHYAQMLQHGTATAIVTVRPALVYGPGQSSDFFIPSLIARCLRHEDFAMSEGHQRRDLLYIDDLVGALVRAGAREGLGGTVINVGHGFAHAMVDVAREIVALSGSTGVLRIGALPARSRDIEHLVADTSRAKALLSWTPGVSLTDGLRRTIAWHRAQASDVGAT
ncbi:MAG: SDR family NAD(P)-dependent oxidoreductase [Gemmatimonadota bacterium]|nr:SDR family NAD(P)-dependent oxidoreductase [Gemmatimonadota bacterium]